MLVDFMVIGAQKCATTSIASYLADHPDVCFCSTKEPGFFSATSDWKAHIEEYHRLFSPAEGQICGEASTMYTFLPEYLGTHERLHAYNPDLRLIYVMRNPVERVISNYSHRVARRTVRQPPEEVVFADPTYLNRSRYAVQIEPYLELFGGANVLLLLFEEYAAEPQATLGRIAEFLGISREPFSAMREKAEHSSAGGDYLHPSVAKLYQAVKGEYVASRLPPKLRRFVRGKLANRIEKKPVFSPVLRETLWRFLLPDVRRIEQIMGRRLDLWREAMAPRRG